ncbi:hypothetical protein [Streptomyces mirabilis]|uniref:hypothetical protein n=1 Tax=Streptomyces mirabilis TaxID=68239 RepID=UPI0021BDF809|nr:hypothetical protein [Streptomyces mirabilis]MCT9107567.1 hypothetical protein [Streptomyces mirabilis]
MSEFPAPLRETLSRIAEQDLALDAEGLSRRTGISVQHIQTLLDGGELTDEDVDTRIRERLQFLCRQRLAESGRTYRDREAVAALTKDIASAIGVSSVWARQLVSGEKTPSMKHGHELTRYFGVPDGFLTETPAAALNRTLQSHLQNESGAGGSPADPLAELKSRFGLVGISRRGEPLSRDEAARFAGLIAEVLEQNMEADS